MSIVNEDIDNAELSEELVDETQVDSLDEETLEEKAAVKKEEDEVEKDEDDVEEDEDEDEDEVEVDEDADGVDGGDGSDVGSDQEIPKTKAGIVNAAYSMMKKAKKDEAVKLYQGMMKAANMKEDVDADEAVVAEEADVSHIDYQEDLDVLVAEEATLSDGFRGKASTIFEAALKTKVSAEIDRLEGEYAQNLEEEVSSVKGDLVEKVDAYLNYVVEGWMESNAVAVEAGLRTEIAESFMTSLQSVFKEHYLSVPEGKEDLVDELSEQVAELEEQLNKTTDENVELFQTVQESQRADVVRKYTSDLAATEAEKLSSLVEDVEFGDVESFEMKVKTIKESYFMKESVESESEVDKVVGTDQALTEHVSDSMSRYTSALSSHVFK
tara:strand:+ start:1751 stop:2899 length:1149 start_codon:yes stop_codon:yes gene_type:complete